MQEKAKASRKRRVKKFYKAKGAAKSGSLATQSEKMANADNKNVTWKKKQTTNLR